MKALFIGGNQHGKVHEVKPAIRISYEREVPSVVHGEAAFELETYEERPLNMFGRVLRVYVLSGLPDKARDRLATDLLMSPLARDLLEAQR